MAKTVDSNRSKAPPTIVRFEFIEKNKIQPKGYKALCVDQEVTVITKGKIRAIGSSWDESAVFSVDVASCEIKSSADENISLASAVTSADAKRKRVM